MGGGSFEDIPQIDHTQTVVYRIASLETHMSQMAGLIEEQRKTLEAQRIALESGEKYMKMCSQ